MKTNTNHHDPQIQLPGAVQAFTGRFWGRIWDIECVLEFHLDDAGQLQGSFDADGEVLEVCLGPPDDTGLVRGVIRAHDLSEPFATFCTRPDGDGLFLEMDLIQGDEPSLEAAQHVVLARLSNSFDEELTEVKHEG